MNRQRRGENKRPPRLPAAAFDIVTEFCDYGQTPAGIVNDSVTVTTLPATEDVAPLA
jgi:hypothetical protein